jgi:1-pyrroline-5-carboxylate dehydrogenase
MALSGGPSSGALVAGNAVVLKSSNRWRAARLQVRGGSPRCGAAGRVHLVTGAACRGDHLWKHPDVNGVTFTGSYPVGMDIFWHSSPIAQAGDL